MKYRAALVAVVLVSLASAQDVAAPKPGHPAELSAAVKRKLKDVARVAYVSASDGWSTDEVLLQDELNRKYLSECRARMPDVRDFDFNWTLINLRKAGELSDVKTSRRRRDDPDEYLSAAEITARFLEDRHGVNTDRVLCDPELRTEYDRMARELAPQVEPYLLRKASLTLRKSRRLSPELVLRVADWKRVIVTLPAGEAVNDIARIPSGPGVYIFRDASGYLYIGESSDLRSRVKKHLDQSDRQSLAVFFQRQGVQGVTIELHAFDPASDARLKPSRRAYESELIRSRKPRFNLAP